MVSKKIDSHSSGINNYRIQMLLVEIDRLALASGGNYKFGLLKAYYDVVEQLFMNVKDVFVNQETLREINNTRKKFHTIYDMMLSDPSYRIIQNLTKLHRLARKYNSQVITALQADLEYFFRTGTRESKGLLKIPYFERSNYNDEEQI